METLRRKQETGQRTPNFNTSTIITTSNLLFPSLFFVLLLNSLTPVNLVVAADDDPATTTAPSVVNGTEVVNGTAGGGGEGEGGEGEEGGSGGGGTILNETKYENYSDVTKFVDGMNGWDFTGSWAKYDLSQLTEDQRTIPLVPDAEDQGVFICQTSAMTSTLLKDFPALHNATFALTYYAKTDDGELMMTGEVVGVNGTVETVFNQSAQGEGKSHEAGTWGTDTFDLPLLAAMGDFKLRVGVRHSASGVWAAAEMRLEGLTGPPLPPITTPVNATTEAPVNVTTTPTTTTTEEEEEEDVSRLEGIAQAIWDAFYVFLALFCACLVALVALIVHGRCKDDEPPPAVATYNPRTASYRMDKVYDNPSYDNNQV